MLADRVLHTTTTTGTGPYDLIDPTSPLYISAVASVGTGNQLIYAVEFGSSWEICRGVVTTGSPATLTRNLIRSNTGALINWSAGTKVLYGIEQSDVLRFGGRGSLPTSGGSADAQTVAHVTPLRSIQSGMEVVFVPGFTNTTTTTLAVDGLGAIALLGPEGGVCAGGELRVDVPVRAVYNGTNWRVVSYSPSATGAALLASADAAAGRTTLGATATGSALFTATDAAAARTAVGATATGSSLITATDAAAGRTAIGAPPIPTASSGVVGQWVLLESASGANLVLPSGGTWAAFANNYDASTNIFSGVTAVTVAAGGTNILTGLAGFYNKGFCWRIT